MKIELAPGDILTIALKDSNDIIIHLDEENKFNIIANLPDGSGHSGLIYSVDLKNLDLLDEIVVYDEDEEDEDEEEVISIESIFETVKHILAEVLPIDLDNIKENAKLIDDLGMSDIDYADVSVEIVEYLDIELPTELPKDMVTVKDLVDTIHKMT